MPARNKDGSSFPGFGPDNHIVPSDIIEDDELWVLLNTYADGEATAEEVVQVEKLLGSHPAIAREFSFLQLTSDSVREFTDLEPPLAMTEAIFAATTRRVTFARRVSRWWAQAAAAFGPAPLRLAGAALVTGVLAVVMWSKLGPGHHVQPRADQTQVARQQTHPRELVAIVPHVTPRVTPPVHNSEKTHNSANVAVDVHKKWDKVFEIPAVTSVAVAQTSVPSTAADKGTPGKKNQDSPIERNKPRVDQQSPVAGIARTGTNVEERHMVPDGDLDGKGAKPVDLGPDVVSGQDDPGSEVVAKAMPATYEEPPTTVETVSYKPGSISDKTRNAPPAVQSLYMRTQEAIKRQHEMQQYGGYGKDAIKNIQRGEVGLSLVGGKF